LFFKKIIDGISVAFNSIVCGRLCSNLISSGIGVLIVTSILDGIEFDFTSIVRGMS
jgi:hypothetical protein